jgi:hypothetical protein
MQRSTYRDPTSPALLSRISAVAALSLLLALTVMFASPASPAQASTSLVQKAAWIRSGETLSVTPTAWARFVAVVNSSDGNVNRNASNAKVMLGDALSMAGFRPYSPKIYDSMREQLQCHLDLAVKTPYNLDVGRPLVPYSEELRKLCNP